MPCQEARDRDPAPLRAQIREGISWLWSHAYLRTSALIFAGGNFVFSGIYLVFVGALIAVFGGASLAGALLAPRIARRLSMRAIVLGNGG